MAIPVTEQTNDISDSISLEYLVNRIVKNLNKTIAIIILAMFALGIYTYALTTNLFPGGDNAHYLVLADALQSGQGYKTISIISEPYATERPPGFPLLLTPIMFSKNINVLTAKQGVAIWGTITTIVIYFYFKQQTNTTYALGIAFLFAIMPLVFMYSRRVYATMPFTAFTYLILISATIYTRKKHWLNRHLIFLSIFIIIAFYLRTIGAVLLISIAIWFIIKKDYVKAISLIILCIPIIGFWFYWTSQVQQTLNSGYLSQLFQTGGLTSQIQLGISNLLGNSRLVAENFFYLSNKIPQQLHLTNPIFNAINYSIVIFTVFSIIVGFFRVKRISLDKIFLILYMVVLLIWPHVIDRFIVPLLPLLIHYYVQGITQVCLWIRKRFEIPEKLALLFFIGLILEIILSGLIHIPARLYQEHQFNVNSAEMAAYYDVASWVGNNLPHDAIISTYHNNFFYIYSSRQQTVRQKIDANLTSVETPYFVATLSQNIPPTAESLYCSPISDVCIFKNPR